MTGWHDCDDAFAYYLYSTALISKFHTLCVNIHDVSIMSMVVVCHFQIIVISTLGSSLVVDRKLHFRYNYARRYCRRDTWHVSQCLLRDWIGSRPSFQRLLTRQLICVYKRGVTDWYMGTYKLYMYISLPLTRIWLLDRKRSCFLNNKQHIIYYILISAIDMF